MPLINVYRLGPFDETMNHLVMEKEFLSQITRLGMSARVSDRGLMTFDHDEHLRSTDFDIFKFQWSATRMDQALAYYREKWHEELGKEVFFAIIEAKKRRLVHTRKSAVLDLNIDWSIHLSYAREVFSTLFSNFQRPGLKNYSLVGKAK